jgi:hypothetical protein
LVIIRFQNVNQLLEENGGSFGNQSILCKCNKTNNMKYLILIGILIVVWIAYEIWRAPLMMETEDGKLITKRPTKKLSDLWRKES